MQNFIFKIKKFLAACYNDIIGIGCYFLVEEMNQFFFIKSKFKIMDFVKFVDNPKCYHLPTYMSRLLNLKDEADMYSNSEEVPKYGTIIHIFYRRRRLYYVIRFRHNKYIYANDDSIKRIKFRKLNRQKKKNINKINNSYIVERL